MPLRAINQGVQADSDVRRDGGNLFGALLLHLGKKGVQPIANNDLLQQFFVEVLQ